MVLRLDHRLAPVKAAVFRCPSRALLPTAHEPGRRTPPVLNVDYDETQSIGKRYRRQDEIGTPFCITVDFDTIEDQAVTIRARDTMTQERVALSQVKGFLADRLLGA